MDPLQDYRQSHVGARRALEYEDTYLTGYYAAQWTKVEAPLVDRLVNDIVARGARTALDFACGTGRILGLLQRHFVRPVGVDVSPDMLRVAAKRCAASELICADVTSTSLGRQFDLITAFRFFLNAEPSLRLSALRALASLLAANGTLLLNVHVNATSPVGLAYRVRNAVYGRRVANVMSLDQIEGLLGATGFRITDVRWYGFMPRPGPFFSAAVERLVEPVERIATGSGMMPKRLAQCFVVEAKRCQESASTSG